VKPFAVTIAAFLVLSGGVLAFFWAKDLERARLEARVHALEREREELIDFAQRLTSSRRVAQVDVVGQRSGDDGRTVTELRWQEIGDDGALGAPLSAQVHGRQVYFEALVLKFEPRYLREGDATRGASLALFRRIFGDEQAPQTGVEVGRDSRPPTRERDAVRVSHDRLWGRFWEFVEQPALAREYGVRVAQCESPSVAVRPGQTWEVSLDVAGGLNVRKLSTQ
jgi:hypothetical protein